MTRTLACALADAGRALANCERSGNKEWILRWKARIRELVELLPSGSGVDNGTEIVTIASDRIVLSCGFHHMDENGSYDGWTEHRIVVRPDWYGIKVTVGGRDRNGIKEYLGELYYAALSETIPELSGVGTVGTAEASLPTS